MAVIYPDNVDVQRKVHGFQADVVVVRCSYLIGINEIDMSWISIPFRRLILCFCASWDGLRRVAVMSTEQNALLKHVVIVIGNGSFKTCCADQWPCYCYSKSCQFQFLHLKSTGLTVQPPEMIRRWPASRNSCCVALLVRRHVLGSYCKEAIALRNS